MSSPHKIYFKYAFGTTSLTPACWRGIRLWMTNYYQLSIIHYSMKRFLRPWRIFLYILFWLRFLFGKLGDFFGNGDLGELDTTVLVQEGNTLSDVFDEISSWMTTLKLKRFLKKNPEIISTLQPGSYIFSGSYNFEDFFSFLDAGPQISYTSVTLLEGWSIYDIDAALTRKEYIYGGEYADFVTNDLIISKYINRYEFLELANEQSWWLTTLEWFLYPETYFIDTSKNFIDQLIYLQLETFKTTIWDEYAQEILSHPQYLQQQWIQSSLDRYEMMILASVIEKEERVDKNKAKIASVFLNRLDNAMRIDADITLCYGLQEPYDACPPAVIAANLDDKKNEYNTRALGWLPPTPIANIHLASLTALLEMKKSDNFFYLHDEKWQIHLSKDLSQHNIKKSKYIK